MRKTKWVDPSGNLVDFSMDVPSLPGTFTGIQLSVVPSPMAETPLIHARPDMDKVS